MIGWYECMTTHSDACILLALCMVDILGCWLTFQKLHAHTSKFSAWTLSSGSSNQMRRFEVLRHHPMLLLWWTELAITRAD